MKRFQRLRIPGLLSALGLAIAVAAVPSAQQTDIGIFVGEPKIYDDQSLQIMLNAARAQLTALRPIDQTSLIARIGSIQGADLRQSSVGVQVNGLPSPSNATTTSTATPSPVVTSDTTTTTPVDPTFGVNRARARVLPRSGVAAPVWTHARTCAGIVVVTREPHCT